MSIPALIVPVLNRPELLDAMLRSIDHPVAKVVIIDNGDVLDEGWREWNPQYRVIQPGHNLGVSASWNLGIKATPQAPWWLIVNHDIAFGAGDLARLEETVNPGAAALYFMLGMASFAITRHTVNSVGLFDESFINAYNEDLDYARRCDLAGLPRVEAGFTGSHVGSATIMADPAMRAWNGSSHGANDVYYARKWGGPKQGGETFATPFNRGAGLGEWQFDLERYRNQTWPRPKQSE